jgi:hypothetical protein
MIVYEKGLIEIKDLVKSLLFQVDIQIHREELVENELIQDIELHMNLMNKSKNSFRNIMYHSFEMNFTVCD